MKLTVERPFGATITGLTIDDISRDEAEAFRSAVAHHRVVVLRDTAADDARLVAFLSALGEMMFTEGEIPVAGTPALNLVSNVGRITPPRSVFHTDTSYLPRPPALSALLAVVVPGAGGATLFSDQVDAVRRLPSQARDWLHGRSIAHSATIAGQTVTTRQPLLRRHPLTGEVALYLSTPERCTALIGVDAETSARVIAALYRHSVRRKYLKRHVWRPGDVVVWDNRVTMHKADHDAVVGDRVLHRGLVRGETPIMA